MDSYRLCFDGSCGPKNPGGTAGYGYILYKNEQEIKRDHGIVGKGPEMSNNLAEHYAAAEGMKYFLSIYDGEWAELEIVGDSMLVLNHLNYRWKGDTRKLYYPQYVRSIGILELIKEKGVNVCFKHKGRLENQECDRLSKMHRKSKK